MDCNAGIKQNVLKIKDLICFWDFQEADGLERESIGPYQYGLKEVNGPIKRMSDGIFGGYSALIEEGQWFNIPRAQCPALNIHGKNAQVTVAAWIKWDSLKRCQAIAGMWDESRRMRQYCLFLNLSGRYGSARNVHGHVSGIGGHTHGDPCCITYSTGKTVIPLNEWCMIAFTYDGQFSRAYVNGKLDENGIYNPYFYDEGIFDGGKDGSDFTVGSVSAGGRPNNFYKGLIGGLAVYSRALTETEIESISVINPVVP